MRTRRARPLWVAVVAVVAVGAACSGSDGSTRCVDVTDASICAARDDGQVTFTAEGLQPGSVVTVVSTSTGSTEIPVAANGGFDGEFGVMSASGDVRGEFSVEAIAEDGTPFTARLAFE